MAEPGDIVCQEQGWRGGGGGLLTFLLCKGGAYLRGGLKRGFVTSSLYVRP